MGPLAGLKVLEFNGLGPAPFACMVLADLGADVLRIDRAGADNLLGLKQDFIERGRRSLVLDLKSAEGLETAKRLAGAADVLVEGFRPGVMERLGLGPEPLCAANPRLIYARMTGWGQTGPLAPTAGHDITYLALSGALHAIGTAEDPLPPLNLPGDFGGGSMFLITGILSALYERQRSGQGQVIDAAITDGAAVLMAMIYAMRAEGLWEDRRAANLLDGAAAIYRTYVCADGRHVAIAPMERKFFEIFAARAGLNAADWPNHADPAVWPALHAKLAALFLTRPRDEWCALFEGSDACVAPVLSLDEAPRHPHNQARGAFVEIDGVIQPAPAPRFSRSVPPTPAPRPAPNEGGEAALLDWLGE
ncbi:CaiB/BaiF CoA transferase family protein [Acidocella aromatica]|uniref:Alpha-methylacyl-CoA racemase n=1 Tax=Acidocella aromatica TaxID=1303579 RepID=A0A840VC39_9PROT|nr:CaiB/BaiF CoA-transferase family protein [Acidocella aromatica]MBB5373353.1 alpha-methylacyl-CoA racemase [Acidocella aromatica]